ncbi:hypothetical protein CEXT_757881 [Caerostris extrusa]|uniref:Uncharacterized protein n=1 Tax=Caerostris extrusa TaxID=172846 RepID=A0AAV4P734_CAEEX|nr:hypothetical protein CEXT_757881 [Caerostris extrusa]
MAQIDRTSPRADLRPEALEVERKSGLIPLIVNTIPRIGSKPNSFLYMLRVVVIAENATSHSNTEPNDYTKRNAYKEAELSALGASIQSSTTGNTECNPSKKKEYENIQRKIYSSGRIGIRMVSLPLKKNRQAQAAEDKLAYN